MACMEPTLWNLGYGCFGCYGCVPTTHSPTHSPAPHSSIPGGQSMGVWYSDDGAKTWQISTGAEGATMPFKGEGGADSQEGGGDMGVADSRQ